MLLGNQKVKNVRVQLRTQNRFDPWERAVIFEPHRISSKNPFLIATINERISLNFETNRYDTIFFMYPYRASYWVIERYFNCICIEPIDRRLWLTSNAQYNMAVFSVTTGSRRYHRRTSGECGKRSSKLYSKCCIIIIHYTLD